MATDYERGVREMAALSHNVCNSCGLFRISPQNEAIWLSGKIGTKAHAQIKQGADDLINKELMNGDPQINQDSVAEITSGGRTPQSDDLLKLHRRFRTATKEYLLGCIFFTSDKEIEKAGLDKLKAIDADIAEAQEK